MSSLEDEDRVELPFDIYSYSDPEELVTNLEVSCSYSVTVFIANVAFLFE